MATKSLTGKTRRARVAVYGVGWAEWLTRAASCAVRGGPTSKSSGRNACTWMVLPPCASCNGGSARPSARSSIRILPSGTYMASLLQKRKNTNALVYDNVSTILKEAAKKKLIETRKRWSFYEYWSRCTFWKRSRPIFRMTRNKMNIFRFFNSIPSLTPTMYRKSVSMLTGSRLVWHR